MIELYGMGSPNVLKVGILLEEIGLPYKMRPVHVMKNENLTPAFLALNPMGKVPVMVDHDGPNPGQPIFESGAILIYLAETYGPAFLPASGPARWEILEWLMVQMSFAGPMLGQVNHFQLLPSEAGSYGSQRFLDQAARLYRTVDERLGASPWLGGEAYSIADMAMYPWSPYLERHGFKPADHPNLIAWRERIDQRPAVKHAVAKGSATDTEELAATPLTEENLDRFFSRTKPGPAVDIVGYMALGPMTTAQPE